MAKTRLVSARSELKKGYTMPTKKRIKTFLMRKSKGFLADLVLMLLPKVSKTTRIKVFMKIDRASNVVRKAKRKAKRKVKLKVKTVKKRRTAKQKAATRKLVALNKKRKAKKKKR